MCVFINYKQHTVLATECVCIIDVFIREQQQQQQVQLVSKYVNRGTACAQLAGYTER